MYTRTGDQSNACRSTGLYTEGLKDGRIGVFFGMAVRCAVGAHTHSSSHRLTYTILNLLLLHTNSAGIGAQ